MAAWLPLHHDMGLIGCFLAPTSLQVDLHLMPPAQFVRRPAAFVSLFDRGGATISAMPSFGLDFIARRVAPKALEGIDLSGWRTLIVGAERVSSELLDTFSRALAPAGFRPGALCPAYGMAENTLAITGSPPGEPPRTVSLSGHGGSRYVSCGRPLPGTEVRVVDPEGRSVGEGVVGEIGIRSPSLFRGYRGTPSRSTRLVAGELRTGDAGFLLGGELFVVGRMGDAVKVRGTWLFAEDLEARAGHPAFHDRRAAVVVGQDGDEVRVLVICDRTLDLDTGDIEAYLKTEGVAASVTVVPARRTDMLYTTSGKPRRREMWLRYTGASSDRTAGTA